MPSFSRTPKCPARHRRIKLPDARVVSRTAEADVPNTLMHVVGNNDYDTCKARLIQQIKENFQQSKNNVPMITHVIAVSGPDGATQVLFENSWYGNIRQAVMTSPSLKAKPIRWGPAQINHLRAAPGAIKNCFALLQDGRFGPSRPPPPPSSSSSSSSDSSWGNAQASWIQRVQGRRLLGFNPPVLQQWHYLGTAGKKVVAVSGKKIVAAAPVKKATGKH